jgi:hypothetical protein
VWQLDREKKSDAAVEYFALADLWEHYAESSANGLAVPVRHLGHAGESTVVTQHFVPYLSAVQLYTATRPTASIAIPRYSIRSIGNSNSHLDPPQLRFSQPPFETDDRFLLETHRVHAGARGARRTPGATTAPAAARGSPGPPGTRRPKTTMIRHTTSQPRRT